MQREKTLPAEPASLWGGGPAAELRLTDSFLLQIQCKRFDEYGAAGFELSVEMESVIISQYSPVCFPTPSAFLDYLQSDMFS